MQSSSGIDLAATNPENTPEKIEDGKGVVSLFHCDLYDTEIVHKIAQVFLPGIATACVDNTTGDIFKIPATVAFDLRKEMVEYLNQRSENFVAETVIVEGGPEAEASDHPYDIISDFVDDFASLKRNLLSRVSGWLLSEKREDKIDDFVQEMEINGFWLVDKRETIAQGLLKNVDFKNEYHCGMKFDSPEELAEHVQSCGFRPMTCQNMGCNAVFCLRNSEKHDSACAFKIIPCEQMCSENVMRREMDRHCVTVCPMRLVSCHFYAVGCQSPLPHSMLEQHRLDDLHSHLRYVLRSIHKEASKEDLKQRVDQLEKASSFNQLANAQDVRSLTSAVKDLETKLGPFRLNGENKDNEETGETQKL
ncbi:TNF receptor-associated factor family protein [Morus notabilis]|uniref:TNF receptor-associated factor family protein n=1 Tax=Morus notabilis TaxID=981085 RepID=W9RJL7_9ROSA|nr:E3 ubiquitin-protein ligase PDZRN3-B isoform X2 [Morus notabilis]EXB80938.1 TNF receptor-associated factor family protein [Morus notabilis]